MEIDLIGAGRFPGELNGGQPIARLGVRFGQQAQQVGGRFLADLVARVLGNRGRRFFGTGAGQGAMRGRRGGEDVCLIVGDRMGQNARSRGIERGGALECAQVALEELASLPPFVV